MVFLAEYVCSPIIYRRYMSEKILQNQGKARVIRLLKKTNINDLLQKMFSWLNIIRECKQFLDVTNLSFRVFIVLITC